MDGKQTTQKIHFCERKDDKCGGIIFYIFKYNVVLLSVEEYQSFINYSYSE